jgi:hypothetical protein
MKKYLIVAAIAFIALAILLSSTNPNNVSSIGLLAPFVLLFVLLTSLLIVCFERSDLGKRQRIRLSALCAGLPCMLLVLRSVDQLTARDVIILMGFFFLSGFYVSRSARFTPRS